jgi:hypothetical protein
VAMAEGEEEPAAVADDTPAADAEEPAAEAAGPPANDAPAAAAGPGSATVSCALSADEFEGDEDADGDGVVGRLLQRLGEEPTR